jgi:hypothetical protein
MLFKTLIIGLLIAVGEVVNGNIRVRIWHRLLGKRRAKTLSFFTGSLIIFIIAWFSLDWIHPQSYEDCFKIGLVWLLIMLSLDLYFGRYVFKFSWAKIADDFNILKGNLISLGMTFLLFVPTLIYWLKH